jgi:hypothetical protein
MIWNGKPLRPILDDLSGNSRDNSPENLRFLCPNCDSQNHETRDGANAGRIKSIGSKGSYQDHNHDGTVAGHAVAGSFGSEESVLLPGAIAVI